MRPNIKGFTRYHIDERGNLLNTATKKYLKGTTNNEGYIVYCLINDDGEKKVVKQHRLIALAYIPNPENKPHVHHIDSNRSNNTLSNLEWVHHHENMKYMIEAGRANKRKPTKHYVELKEGVKLTKKQQRFVEAVNRLNYVDLITNELGIKERAFYQMLSRVKKRLSSSIDG